MKALVTGGAGFIGSHLCQRLLQDGYEVICIDNLITGNRDNIAHLTGDPRFQFIEHDIVDPLDIPADLVFHLASPASPPGYLQFPVQTALANSIGTYNTLEMSRRYEARFLMASTSESYGDPLEHPQREEYWGNVNPIGVRSCYDESKRFSESLTMTYLRFYDLDARIIRIFNTYGPNSDPNDGRLVPNFITQALKGEPITVFGTGQQTRSLCYVSDLVEGMTRAMCCEDTKGMVVNLGTPDEHTVLEYAQIIKRLTGSKAPIEFRPYLSEDDPTRRCPDITRAREKLNWEPLVGLEEGLGLTIEWFRQRLKVSR